MTTHQGTALQAAVRHSAVQDGVLIVALAAAILTAILTTAPTPHGATEAGGESSTFLASLEQE